MIVRMLDRTAAPLPDVSIAAPAGVRGVLACIDTLHLTSGEILEMYGIRVSRQKIRTSIEAASAVADFQIRTESWNKVLPFFVGYQEIPGEGALPFLTDGSAGEWSLFLMKNGRTMMVTRKGRRLHASAMDHASVAFGRSHEQSPQPLMSVN